MSGALRQSTDLAAVRKGIERAERALCGIVYTAEALRGLHCQLELRLGNDSSSSTGGRGPLRKRVQQAEEIEEGG